MEAKKYGAGEVRAKFDKKSYEEFLMLYLLKAPKCRILPTYFQQLLSNNEKISIFVTLA